MKKYVWSAGLAVLLVCAFLFSGCQGEPKAPPAWRSLPTPEGLFVNEDERLIWEPVEGAHGYHVEIDGRTDGWDTQTNSFDLFPYIRETKIYSLRVRAVGVPFEISRWSDTLEYSARVFSDVSLQYDASLDGYVVSSVDASLAEGKVVVTMRGEDGSVLSVGAGAFRNCTKIKSVLLPGLIFSIGGEAFAGCEALSRVSGADSLRLVGEGAFRGCRSLQTFDFPSTMTKIGENAFAGCDSMKGVTLVTADGVQISENAFPGHTLYVDGIFYAVESGHNAGRTIVSGCRIAQGKDGERYLVSFYVKKPVDGQSGTIIGSTDYLVVPHRADHVFAGWATEEDGEVVYAPSVVGTRTVCFADGGIDALEDETLLYAVWEAV